MINKEVVTKAEILIGSVKNAKMSSSKLNKNKLKRNSNNKIRNFDKSKFYV